MLREIPTFHAPKHLYYSDTCEELKQGAERGEIHLSARAQGAYPGAPLPSDELNEVRTVGYWNACHDQSWGLDWHRNEGIELTYVSRGHDAFGLDNTTYDLRSGNLTITRPWQRHRLGNPNVTACHLSWLILDVNVRRPNQPWIWPAWLLMSDEERQYLATVLRNNEQPVWRATDEITFYFRQLGRTIDHYETPVGNSQMKLAINGLLIALVDMLRAQNPLLTPSLSSTQRAVELFLAALPQEADRAWTVDSMADACGLKRRMFTYYCQQIANITPMSYLIQCRIDRSCQLLRAEPDLSITEIAFRSGFASSQYFSTVFRSRVGVSPREYRLRPLPNKSAGSTGRQGVYAAGQ